jgi:hypothetical protein
MSATLARLKQDPRVADAFRDSDGYWVWMRPGWTADPRDAHDIHEDTIRAVLARFRGVQPCACDGCREALGCPS